MRVPPRIPWVSLTLAALAVGLFACGVPTVSVAWTPAAPSITRLLLCHVGHWNRAHLVFDVASLLLTGLFAESSPRRKYLVFVIVSVVLIPPLSCLATPALRGYAGLSGLVVGHLGLVLGCEVREAKGRAPLVVIVIVGLALEFVREWMGGGHASIFAGEPGVVGVPAAHLVGLVVGAIVGAVPNRREFHAVLRPRRWTAHATRASV